MDIGNGNIQYKLYSKIWMAYADYFDRLLTFETFFLFADNLKGETPLRSLFGNSLFSP